MRCPDSVSYKNRECAHTILTLVPRTEGNMQHAADERLRPLPQTRTKRSSCAVSSSPFLCERRASRGKWGKESRRGDTGRDVPFCGSVPVLSLSRYSILPSSSGNVLILTITPGIIGNLKTYTYHRPRKPLRATSTSDRASVTAHKI